MRPVKGAIRSRRYNLVGTAWTDGVRHVPASKSRDAALQPLAEGPTLYYSSYKGTTIPGDFLPNRKLIWTSPVVNCFNWAA